MPRAEEQSDFLPGLTANEQTSETPGAEVSCASDPFAALLPLAEEAA